MDIHAFRGAGGGGGGGGDEQEVCDVRKHLDLYSTHRRLKVRIKYQKLLQTYVRSGVIHVSCIAI